MRRAFKTESTRFRGSQPRFRRPALYWFSSFVNGATHEEGLGTLSGRAVPLTSRRKFIRAAAATGGAGIVSAVELAIMGARRSANKIDRRRSEMESPIEVVRRFCAAWSDNVGAAELAAFFTDDAVYHNIPLAPVTGRKAIPNTIASFIRPGAPGIESIEFPAINIAANGRVVMTERVDVFRLPGKSFELQVMGTFEVRD